MNQIIIKMDNNNITLCGNDEKILVLTEKDNALDFHACKNAIHIYNEMINRNLSK